MKIDEKYLKFPQTLPNDLEDFMIYYPYKFPLIINEYENAAKRVANSVDEFRKYGDWARDELWAGFEKIKKDYENGNQNDLEFLVEIDQRFNKLFCYRFWIVNYLFADGPLHDFFVDNLRSLIHKFVDVGEDVEDFEQRILGVQRDLLQGDYADLYLQQALNGDSLMQKMHDKEVISKKLDEVTKLIDLRDENKKAEINVLWDDIVYIIKEERGDLLDEIEIPLRQTEMRGNMAPLYNMLTHTVEFRNENKDLVQRNKDIKNRIEEIMAEAKDKFNKDEFELLRLSYGQINNMTMYKDIMGEIDGPLLPLWFGIHDKIRAILTKDGVDMPKMGTGPGSAFYFYVWYLPDNLKAKIMTPDLLPFNLETI